MAHAIDVSNYQSQMTLGDAQNFRAVASRIIIGGQNFDDMRKMYDLAAQAGFTDIDVYQYYYHTGNPLAWRDKTTATLDALQGRVIGRFWIDCEDDSASNYSALACRTDIAMAAAACEGRVFSGIYTRKDWWVHQVGDTQAFASFPLWDCTVRGAGAALPSPAPGYGGWAASEMEQVSWHYIAPGTSFEVDLDIFDDGTTPPPPSDRYEEGRQAGLQQARDAVNSLS